MKEVIFVRHAKSDWGNEFLQDVDRHLNERGYSDAYFLSEWYLKNKTLPQLILSSTAIRAMSTALIFARKFNARTDAFALEKDLYEASHLQILAVLKKQNNSLNSVMLFGHNPGLTSVCNELTNDLFFDNIPTCGMVSLSFEITKWSDLNTQKGKLNYYQFPKEFKNKD